MSKSLIDEIYYNIEIGGEEELDFLLDPTKSVLMYKHIKTKLHNLPKKYVIKVKESYFPRFFDNINDALDFGGKIKEIDLTDSREKVFAHLTMFETFSVEEI